MSTDTKKLKEETFIRGIRLGRIAGIGIHLDWSWLVTTLLIVWNVGSIIVPKASPNGGIGLYLGLGAAASLLFFVSILAHELAHAITARSLGVPVKRISLYIFGGVTAMEREPGEAEEEFRIAIAGPLTSLLLGFIFVMIGYAGRFPPLAAFINPQSYETTIGPVLPILQWLGPLNILMGLFNMLPGFPLDGGRVLRSILWARTGDLRVATRYTYLAGQVLAGALLAVGAAMTLGINLPILGSNLMNGMWIALIGWFLLTSSARSEPQEKAQESLEGIPVERLMRKNIAPTSPAMPLGLFVSERLMKTDDAAYPVIYQDKLVGLVTMEHIRETPRENWDKLRVAEVMATRDRLTVVSPRSDSMDALHLMVRKAAQVIPVVDGKRLAGMLYYSDLLDWMKARSEGPMPGGNMNPDTHRE